MTRNGTRPLCPFLENTRRLLRDDAEMTWAGRGRGQAESGGGYKGPDAVASSPPSTHLPIRHLPPATVLCGLLSSGSNNNANPGAVKLITG